MSTICKLLLGDNPLIGVDHLSRQRARERREMINTERGLQVVQQSLNGGAEGFCFSTHPTSYGILQAIRKQGSIKKLRLYPLLPYAMGYVRLATEKGLVGLLKHVLEHLNWADRFSLLLTGGISVARMNAFQLYRSYLNMELSAVRNLAPRDSKIEVVFMHEVLTDACVAFDTVELMQVHAEHISSNYKAMPGFVTRNLPRFIQLCKKNNLPLKDIVIMTPLNATGFQMPPSKADYEQTIGLLKDCHIVAISILAGGFLTLDKAVTYLNGLPNIESICVGTSHPEHAFNTFSYLKSHWTNYT